MKLEVSSMIVPGVFSDKSLGFIIAPKN